MQGIWATCLRAVRFWIATLQARASIFYNLLPFLKTPKQDATCNVRTSTVHTTDHAPNTTFEDAIPIPASPYQFLSLGSTGWVYKLNENIVVKKCYPDRNDALAHEQKTFAELNKRQPFSPYIIQHFHHTHNAIFLPYMSGGSIGLVLEYAKIKDKTDYSKVLRVEKLQSAQDCLKWMRQLAAAAAWLEQQGFAHCDIRPHNLLLSSGQNVRLIDFDQVHKVGDSLPLLREPFARELRDEDGLEKGDNNYGLAGPRSEQFAIGTVAFALTRGYEPYETEWWGYEHFVIMGAKFKNMEFPPLDQPGMWDTIIENCWNGRYTSIAQLAEYLASLDQSQEIVEQPLSASEISLRKQECEALAQSGVVETLYMR